MVKYVQFVIHQSIIHRDNLFAKFIEIATVLDWMHIFVMVYNGNGRNDIWISGQRASFNTIFIVCNVQKFRERMKRQ